MTKAQLEKALEKSNGKAKGLDKKLTIAQNANEQLNKRNNFLKGELTTIGKAKDEAKATVRKNEKSIKGHNRQVLDLEGKITDLKNEIANLDNKVSDQVSKLSSCRSSLNDRNLEAQKNKRYAREFAETKWWGRAFKNSGEILGYLTTGKY